MARAPTSSPRAILKQCVRDGLDGTATVPRRLVGCEVRFADVDEKYVIVRCPNPTRFHQTFRDTHVVAVTFSLERRTGSFLAHVMGLEPTGQALLSMPTQVGMLDPRRAPRIPIACPSRVRARLIQGNALVTACVCDATAYGLGLELDEGQVPLRVGATLSMHLSWASGELETWVTVANVRGRRCGVKIALAQSRQAGLTRFVQEQFSDWFRAQRRVVDAGSAALDPA